MTADTRNQMWLGYGTKMRALLLKYASLPSWKSVIITKHRKSAQNFFIRHFSFKKLPWVSKQTEENKEEPEKTTKAPGHKGRVTQHKWQTQIESWITHEQKHAPKIAEWFLYVNQTHSGIRGRWSQPAGKGSAGPEREQQLHEICS